MLSSKFPPSLLEQHKIRLSVVGCGDYKMIDSYRDHLSCPYPIYSDESKKAYEVLGMTKRTFDLGDTTPEYQKKGMGSTVWTSIGVSLELLASCRCCSSLPGNAASLFPVGAVCSHCQSIRRASSRWASSPIRATRSRSEANSCSRRAGNRPGAIGWR